jgi:hypothetical protein
MGLEQLSIFDILEILQLEELHQHDNPIHIFLLIDFGITMLVIFWRELDFNCDDYDYSLNFFFR